MEEYIDEVVQKDNTKEGKGKDKLMFVISGRDTVFFRIREGPYFPTLRVLHKCAYVCDAAIPQCEPRRVM